jgi:GNAT superfamily N-acetyltransferase
MEGNLVRFWGSVVRAVGGEVPSPTGHDPMFSGMPFPLFNGVYRSRLEGHAADAAIERFTRNLDARGLPGFWWVSPVAQPTNLAGRLLARGFAHAGDMPAMALELEAMTPVPVPDSIQVVRVTDQAMLKEWIRITADGSDFPPPVAQMMIERDQSTLFPELRRYLGLLGGQPVAASSIGLTDGLVGVYAVATLPEYRRRGLGTAVSQVPLQEALQLGFKVAVLQATQAGYPVYQRLGFKDIAPIGLYLWPPRG